MTREEARRWLEVELKTWEDECKSKHPIKEALGIAIEALEQETCDDTVTKKAVIETIFKLGSAEELEIDFAKLLVLRRAIKALQPVTPTRKNGKWISCSERLPEEDGEYIVTIKWKGSYSGDVYIETSIGEYRKKSKDWDCVGITAWMPLPGPYNAEMESEE